MQIPYLNQILLVLVVGVLTTVLTIAGIQVIQILRELRETVSTLNKVLEDSHVITSSVAKPISGISGFIMGIKGITDVVNLFSGKEKGAGNG